ncbi:MAG: HAD family hydrolase [Bacilli bacterium]
MNREGELWIFDMDGTLFQTELVALPAFRVCFARMDAHGIAVPDHISDAQITDTLGQTHDVLWTRLMGRPLSGAERSLADAWILEEEVALLLRGVGALFDGVPETLRLLRDNGAQLAVASNGQQRYIETIVSVFGLERLFAGLYSASGYNVTSKVQLVQRVLQDIPCQRAVMVGDRSSDVEAGVKNGMPVIGCAFGFATGPELRGATRIVHRFSDILS